MRQSAGIFVAGLAMLLTPAYAGEGGEDVAGGSGAARRDRVNGATGPQRERGSTLQRLALRGSRMKGWARATGTVLAERLFDAIALCLVGSSAFFLAGETAWGGTLGVAGLLGAGTMWIVLPRRSWGPPGGGPCSFPCWPGSAAPSPSTPCARDAPGRHAAAGHWHLQRVHLARGPDPPAGRCGGGGHGHVDQAPGVRRPPQQAVLVAVLVRLLTVWLTAALSASPAAGACGGDSASPRPVTGSHFDALAADYAEQLSATARERRSSAAR